MSKKKKNYLIEKKRIMHLAEQVSRQYQDMADEREQLHEWEWENDFDFTILGLIELYSSYVGGYASQIAMRGTVQNPTEAIEYLQEKRFFDQSYLVEWYFAPNNDYLKVKKYIEDVDYLRLLVIQYLRLLLDGMLSAKEATDKMDSTFVIASDGKFKIVNAVIA